MDIDYEILFICAALAGLGIFAGIHNLIKQQPPRHFSKVMIASLGIILGDVAFL